MQNRNVILARKHLYVLTFIKLRQLKIIVMAKQSVKPGNDLLGTQMHHFDSQCCSFFCFLFSTPVTSTCVSALLCKCSLGEQYDSCGISDISTFFLGFKEEMKLCLDRMYNANMQSMTFHKIYPWPLAKMRQVKLFAISEKALHMEHEATSSKQHTCTA